MPVTHASRAAKVPVLLIAIALVAPVAVSQLSAADTHPRAATGTHGMVATAHPLASEAALGILRKGGNAVDAAVAAAFAIGVVEPDGSGLGGGGGALIYRAKERQAVYINYYPRASSGVAGIGYRGRPDAQTAKAVLVPGTVAGLTRALELYGTLPLATVIAPAIRLARDGFPVDETLAKIILDNVSLVQRDSATAAVYLRDGFPLAEGDTLRQPDLARTLTAIAVEGRAGFYAGPVARAIAEEVRNAGGAMTLEDLSTMDAQVREPLRGTYRGYELLTAPPPHSGVHIQEALNMLEFEPLGAARHYARSGETLHLMAEVLRRVYADRTSFLADPLFEQVPVEGLMSKPFARSRVDGVNRAVADPKEYRKTPSGDPFAYQAERVRPSRPRPSVPEVQEQDARDDTVRQLPLKAREPAPAEPIDGAGGHTTHLCVVDRDGNTVSLTQTLGTFFGSGVTAAGVLLNNAMSNFSTTAARNRIEPGKQPRSSIAPTIVLRDGGPFMAVGSPGATRIIGTVVQLIVNVLDFGMTAEDANAAPRFHCQKADDYLHVEGGVREYVLSDLRSRGHTLQAYGDLDLYFGGAQLILRDPATGAFSGSADPRRGGSAVGY